MIPNPEIDKLIKNLTIEYNDDDGFKFTDSFIESGFIEQEIESTIKIYQDQMDSKIIPLLLNLAWYGVDRFVFSIFNKEDEALAKTELGRAIAYSYYATFYGAKACKCFHGRIEIPMKRMSLLFGITFLSDDWGIVKSMGDILIDSLNAKNCIIKRGDEEAIRSWFLIELYSLSSKKEVNKKIARYPEEYAPYNKVLENWDSNDLGLVDTHIYELCDLHLIYTFSDITPEIENERKTEYEIPSFQIFPYEVLAWLAIRKRHGLDNPRKISHPLMNTSLARIFLQEIAIAQPQDLPYAEELLTKLKEICPDMTE